MLKKFILNKLLLHKKNTFYEHDSDFIIYKNDDISKEIMINGLYEKNILQGLIKNIFPKLNLKKNLIDIGSNIGNHSVFFSKFFNLIFSFEPVARNFKILEINTEGKKNIKVFNYGCSNIRKDAYCNVKLKNNYGNYSIINKKSALGEKVKLQKLDNLVLKNKIKNIGVIKIDVEGHEFDVVMGAEQTILKYRPVVQLEMVEHQPIRFNWNCQQIYDWFFERDYVPTLSTGKFAGRLWHKYPREMERFFIPKEELETNPSETLFEGLEESHEEQDRPYWNYEAPARKPKEGAKPTTTSAEQVHMNYKD